MTTPEATPCEFCPDGHRDPRLRHWGVYVGPERDGDGQPATLHVMISNGAHVAGSDADWLWKLIRAYSGVSVEEVTVPPGPCPFSQEMVFGPAWLCTLRAGHAGQHEHQSDEGYDRWSA